MQYEKDLEGINALISEKKYKCTLAYAIISLETVLLVQKLIFTWY